MNLLPASSISARDRQLAINPASRRDLALIVYFLRGDAFLIGMPMDSKLIFSAIDEKSDFALP